jgi:dTDP-4-dehydrorhamnose 3,5-epimerase
MRAWQGHKLETKQFFVSKGSFLFAWVKIDDWENPSSDLTVNKAIITADEPTVLTVLAGHANGFKALEDDSTVVVFSNLSQQESSADMYRFEKKTWSLQ